MTLQFEQLPAREQAGLAIEPYDKWRTLDGDVAASFYRAAPGYLLRFPDCADFAIDLDLQIVRCTPAPDMAEENIADLYFNQILPLLMGYAGDPVLHASGIAIDGVAVGFIGPTGRGKSTLAAAFARAGFPFLTDDGLILDPSDTGYCVRPRRPILRLCADSEAAILDRHAPLPEVELWKERLHASAEIPFHDTAVPLAALYVLAEPSGCKQTMITKLTPTEALSALMGHSFILDVEDRPRVRALFNRLGDVAEQIGCYSLDYPRDYADLPSVLEAIITNARKGGKCS